MTQEALIASYHLSFEDGLSCLITVSPAGDAGPDALPEWTRLAFHQCVHCPLDPEQHAYCPFAVAMVKPLDALQTRNSYDPVEVTVDWRGRQVRQSTTLQRALGSLIPLISASSGCPHTEMMRAMAWFHLPFSSVEETLYRLLGTYLLGQYLRGRNGLEADTELHQMPALYSNLRRVNQGMARRLRAISESDSGVNGLVLMDIMVADTGDSLSHLEESLEPFFKEYLNAT